MITIEVAVKKEAGGEIYRESRKYEDFDEAVTRISRHGFMTSDETGPIWFPVASIVYIRQV